MQEIAELRQMQVGITDEAKKQEIRKRIEQKQMEFNLMMERQKRLRSSK